MPAETAEIEFAELGESLRVDRPPPPSGPVSAAQIRVGGWQRARSGGEALRGGLPVRRMPNPNPNPNPTPTPNPIPNPIPNPTPSPSPRRARGERGARDLLGRLARA